MPGATTRHSLPYPNGTEPAGQGDTNIKNLAEALDEKLDLATMPDSIGKRARNLCTYNESISNGTGLILIQTNIPGNSGTMSVLNIKGYVYEPDNNTIDLSVSFYPYSVDSSIVNAEVTNMGSFHGTIQILNRNSDGKVAIAITSGAPSAYWNYPKMAVDGIFGHNLLTNEQLLTGWSISRVADLTGYTVKVAPLSPRPSAEDTGWITPTLTGGWTQYNLSNWPTQYRRKGGIVYIRGLVVPPSGSGGSVSIFTLPTGFRPYKTTLRGAIDAGAAIRHLYLTWDGLIYPNSNPHASWFSVENVVYPVD